MRLSMQELAIVTMAYIGSFVLMIELIVPVQNAVFSENPDLKNLIMLPHGVWIMTFFLCGWVGFIYLLPGTFLMWMQTANGSGATGDHITETAISLITCYIGVKIARHSFKRLQSSSARFSWQQIMVAGVIGSIGHAIGFLLFEVSALSPMIFLAYVIGDITGLFFALLFLMVSFRFFDLWTANALR